MAVDIAIPVAAIEDEETITSRTYAIDWEAGRIAGFIDEQEAVKQYSFSISVSNFFSLRNNNRSSI